MLKGGKNKMKKIILIIAMLLILITPVFALDHYYNISLKYDKGEITYTSLEVIPSEKELKSFEGLFVAEVLSSENDLLNITFFELPLQLIIDTEDGGGEIRQFDEAEIELYIPYFDNANEINIYDKELNKKLTIDVSSYAKPTPTPTITATPTPIPKEVDTTTRNIIISIIIILAVILILILLSRKPKKKK